MPLIHSSSRVYLHQVRTSTNAVLQFDHRRGYGLTVWKWSVATLSSWFRMQKLIFDRPVNVDGERVPPSELSDYRLSHWFRGPCCICPANSSSARERSRFTEAAILLVADGRLAGQYVVSCARGRCGYVGEFQLVLSSQRNTDHERKFTLNVFIAGLGCQCSPIHVEVSISILFMR